MNKPVIGINENVALTAAVLDDKSTITLTFENAAAEKKAMVSHFDNIAGEGVVEKDQSETNIKLFPPTPPKEDPTKTEEQRVDQVVADINGIKGILLHLLKGYLTADEIKGKMQPFAGTTITSENFNTEILKKEVLEAVQRNMGRVFIELITPFLAARKPFRLLLLRQSKDKHYATLRKRYLEENPFWEDMAVPLAATKLGFTNWELSQGLDNDKPVVKPGGSAAGPDAAPQTASSVFG